MVVKIRFKSGPAVTHRARKNSHVALALAALLTPATLTALALGLWKLAADLRVAGQFAIRDGLFSHWLVWLGVALLVHLIVTLLNRYGAGHPILRNSGKSTPITILNSGS